MSIYVHITRRPNPVINSGESIDEETWQSLALSDPEFSILTEAELAEVRRRWPTPLPDLLVESSRPGIAPISVGGRRPPSFLIWTGDPAIGQIWFMWSNGQVEIKNPPESAIAKAMKLAQQLDARVVGENGEIFNPDGTHKGFENGPPIPISAPSVSHFRPGDRVRHAKFGYGRVTFVDGDKVTVNFEKASTKLMIGSFLERA
jgi:hypothetical protein